MGCEPPPCSDTTRLGYVGRPIRRSRVGSYVGLRTHAPERVSRGGGHDAYDPVVPVTSRLPSPARCALGTLVAAAGPAAAAHAPRRCRFVGHDARPGGPRSRRSDKHAACRDWPATPCDTELLSAPTSSRATSPRAARPSARARSPRRPRRRTPRSRRPAVGLVASWEGSNHFDSRYSGNGNQFSGRAAGPGPVRRRHACVRDRELGDPGLRHATGTALLDGDPFFPGTEPVGITLAEFFGLPPEFVRPDGPSVRPPSTCPALRSTRRPSAGSSPPRTSTQDPTTGDFTGGGGCPLAVSTLGHPLGSWNIWYVDTTNNGTGRHARPQAARSASATATTRSSAWTPTASTSRRTSSSLFWTASSTARSSTRFSKADLVAGRRQPDHADVRERLLRHGGVVAYTLQPVNTLPADFVSAHGGTMYFGMSHVAVRRRQRDQVVSLWGLTNTASLDTATPDLPLPETSVDTEEYTVPACGAAAGRPDAVPGLRQHSPCIGVSYPHQFGPLPLDAGSGKVYGAWHARRGGLPDDGHRAGRHRAGVGSTTTAGSGRPIDQHNGVAWFALRPDDDRPRDARERRGSSYVPGREPHLTTRRSR